MKHLVFVFSILLTAGFAGAGAATPPGRINYQGVLRDASGNPLDGPHDMIFRFFDADTAGSEILIDAHLTINGQAVTVSGGLFSVALGSGAVSDGSGPGTFAGLADLFAAHETVYLEVQVGSETLSPRVRVLASAYAQNAARLDGRSAAEFVDTSSLQQIKSGSLVVGTTAPIGWAAGVQGQGADMGGYFSKASGQGYAYVGGYADMAIYGEGRQAGGFLRDMDGTSHVHLASGLTGVHGVGTFAGGYFQDLDGSGVASVGVGERGISAAGNSSGGFFSDANGSGYAEVGVGDQGIQGYGNASGGWFTDLDGSGRLYAGIGDRGVEGYGNEAGGYFQDADHFGYALVGYGERGIDAQGNQMGGSFRDLDSSGLSYVGIGDRGIESYGNEMGGYFRDADNSGYAQVGWGDYGILGYGNAMGGFFKDLDASGVAYVGRGDRGIEAYGNDTGGYFKELDGTGEAYLGYANAGIEAHGSNIGGYFRTTDFSAIASVADSQGYGINARGDTGGGHFLDQTSTGYAYVAREARGIEAYGGEMGGYFEDTNSGSTARLAWGTWGVAGYGSAAGGFFDDTDSSVYAYVGSGAYKILGSGTVSFVQNHPDRDDEVIVYHAPEASEVAVYTRGSGRLVAGQAVIALDPTFGWVTNPDLGLTAHLTPRGPCRMYVESVTTETLTVRCDEPEGSDLVFDYLVYGLRIGFEELAPVQEKQRESYIPSMKESRERNAHRPDLRRYNALERFGAITAEVLGGGVASAAAGSTLSASVGEAGAAGVDLSRARALLAKIGEYDPAIHGPLDSAPTDAATADSFDSVDRAIAPDEADMPRPLPRPGRTASATGPATARPVTDLPVPVDLPAGATWMAVTEAVEAGDVLALDPDDATRLRRAASLADALVVGVAAGASQPAAGDGGLEAPVAVSGITLVRADAHLGEIRPGDLLSASATPGRAVRAPEAVPGTILGKALDPLPAGAGTIRILLQR